MQSGTVYQARFHKDVFQGHSCDNWPDELFEFPLDLDTNHALRQANFVFQKHNKDNLTKANLRASQPFEHGSDYVQCSGRIPEDRSLFRYRNFCISPAKYDLYVCMSSCSNWSKTD